MSSLRSTMMPSGREEGLDRQIDRMLDEALRDRTAEILEACGLARNQLPVLVEGSEAAGFLSDSVADRFGLRLLQSFLCVGGELGGHNGSSPRI